jgi:hypothetical protein
LRRFIGEIVNEATFRDVCTPSGKWFRGRENCFVARLATKQFGTKGQQTEWDGFSRGPAFNAAKMSLLAGTKA